MLIKVTNMKQIKQTSIATAMGAVVLGSLASVSFQANAAPFEMQKLESGYMQDVAEGKSGSDKAAKMTKEGKCGEGKCGVEKAYYITKERKFGVDTSYKMFTEG
jgi:uncharacterized low-complexity protein